MTKNITLTGLAGVKSLIEQTYAGINITVEKRPVKDKKGKIFDAYVLTVPADFSRDKLKAIGFVDPKGDKDSKNQVLRKNSDGEVKLIIPVDEMHAATGIKSDPGLTLA